ncbi:TM2 domain-containing protein 2-like [Styela clava]
MLNSGKLFLLTIFISALTFCLSNNSSEEPVNPYSPLIQCYLLPDEFIECDLPSVFPENKTDVEDDVGCEVQDFGRQRYPEVKTTSVYCRVLDDTIDCAGDRTFKKSGIPCIRYTGYCFVSTLLYSVFLGCLGVDRFCLGHSGTAVAKLLTLGGVGIWWFVDIILLLSGKLLPNDKSNWCEYY